MCTASERRLKSPKLLAHVYERSGEGVGEFGYPFNESIDPLIQLAVHRKRSISELHLIYK